MFTQTAIRMIVAIALVTVSAQLVKLIEPRHLKGWAAALVNFGLSMVAVAMFLPSAAPEIWLARVLIVSAAAAGVHGTAKELLGSASLRT